MGKKFPALTDKQIIKVARKLGFSFYRQAKGSQDTEEKFSKEKP